MCCSILGFSTACSCDFQQLSYDKPFYLITCNKISKQIARNKHAKVYFEVSNDSIKNFNNLSTPKFHQVQMNKILEPKQGFI